LGSTSVVTNQNGVNEENIVYTPYGDRRQDNQNPANVPYKFTGQELDNSTGLYFYGARYYDPMLGRFISADTIVPSAADPQSLNRYSYVRNNPLIYTDPSGHTFLGDFGKIFSSSVGRAIGWAVAPMLMQYVDPATRGYAIAGTAAMAAIYTGGLASSMFYGPFVVGAAGPVLPSVGVIAAGNVIGGAVGGLTSGGIYAAFSGSANGLGQSVLTGAIGGLGGTIGHLDLNPAETIFAKAAIGGAINASQGRSFEAGIAFAGTAALARQVYLGLTATGEFTGITPGPGGEAIAKPLHSPDATFGANNIGHAVRIASHLGETRLTEGGWGSKLLNIVPFVNATAGFHDFLTGDAMLGKSLMTNWPTMLPSFALTVTGSIDAVSFGGANYSLTAPLLSDLRLR
jgi:RHS repeat-associated protein